MPTRPIDPAEPQQPAVETAMKPSITNQPKKPIRRLGLIVDDSLDIPTFKRRAEEAGYPAIKIEAAQMLDGDDQLDVPTFLRKQAN